MAEGFNATQRELEILALRKERAAILTALNGILATFKSHVDGRDLLDELHPRKTIDIKVRVDARERWHEGDWLSNTRDAVREARQILAALAVPSKEQS